MITIGIDSGSLATKGVVLGDDKKILGSTIDLTGGRSRKSGERVYQQVLDRAGLSQEDVDFVVTTGYGRDNLPFSGKNVTEITCHAAGVHFLFPDAATILDIGGQDSKVIRIGNGGRVENFIMNDKCAAGTGRFLEVIAKALEVRLEDLGAISQQTDKNVEISSMCTVFAETEVVSLVAEDTPVPEIVRGVHNVIVERGEILLGKIGLIEPVAMSGGVALNIGVVKALEEQLGLELRIADNPQLTGALGAAVIARNLMEKDNMDMLSTQLRTSITEVTDIHHNRFEILKALNRPKIGWVSIYTPEEILYAAGLIPYRIFGETCTKATKASAYMHRNICPYVLSCLEEVLAEKHDFADGAIIANICDARRRLFDVWKYFRTGDFVHMLDLPKEIDTTTKAYFITEMQHLMAVLEERFGVKITDEALRHAVSVYNQSRELMQRLYDLRSNIHPPITGENYMFMVKAAMTGPREIFNEKLTQLVEELPRHGREQPIATPRIMICGSYFDHPHIIRVIEEMGGMVVCEDISNGVKYFEGIVDEDKEPLAALADYYLDKATCAALFDSGKRFDHMMELIRQYKVDALIYVSLKFCDNNLIDFHYQQKRLAEKKIPLLFLETERMASNMGQLRTRIQAFLESAMLW